MSRRAVPTVSMGGGRSRKSYTFFSLFRLASSIITSIRPSASPKKTASAWASVLLGMQHGGDSPENHGNPPFAIGVGDLPPPLDLDGQHHGDGDQVGGVVEIDFLEVLIDKIDRHPVGKRSGKDHGAVRGEVELGLVAELRPPGVDQF